MELNLEVDSVFYERNGREILKGAYLVCKKGEIVGLLGRNGCGKSTLLEIIFGSLRSAKSFVRIGENVLTGKAYRSGLIKLQPQFRYIPKKMHVATILQMEHISPEDLENELGLNVTSCKIEELSGGQLKLFQVYILLKSSAPFILLDEPFAGLSPIMVEKLVSLLGKAKKSKGIVISDHNYSAIKIVSDRLYFMEYGQTKEIIDMEELKGKYIK